MKGDLRQRKQAYIDSLKAEADYKLQQCDNKIQIALDEKGIIKLQLERELINIENTFLI